MSTSQCWMNGQLMPAHMASLSVFDHGLLYGDGVFEGVRFYHARPFRLEEHLNRLQRSATVLCLKLPYDLQTLSAAVHATIQACGQQEGYIRLVVTRGPGKLGLDPSSCTQPNVFILAGQLELVSSKVREDGARVITAATRRLPPDGLDARIKSLNYLNQILARIEANHAQVDEAIMLNTHGYVAEGTADNVFIVRQEKLYTPRPIDGALEGITRAVILTLAEKMGIAALETALTPYDLYTADECFLTGTGAELIPVRDIDGRGLGTCPGPIFKTLRDAFQRLITQETKIE